MNVLRTQFWVAGLWLALGWVVPLRAAETFASVYLSEFLTENQRGLRDEDGDLSGWIELYNGSAATADLNGWFLTDSPTNLTKWRFPRVGLLPDKYLVVFVSGKNRTNNLANLHTSFRLNQQGGYLALANPATNVVSAFAPGYPPQSADISYGRVRGEPATRGFFRRPTPGRPNASSGRGFAPKVKFSPPGGTFTAPFSLQLSSGASNTVIRYTLDGALPTSNSLVYAEPLQLTNTAYVRARVYQEGVLPGPPQGVAYLLLQSNALSFTSTLPVLIIETFGRDLPTSSPRYTLAHFSFYEPVHGVTSLTNPPTLTTRAGFHVRGSSSGGMPQSNFAVQLLDEFNQEQHLPVLGLPTESDWILYGPNGYEPVMIHNPFVHQLSRDMGRYSPRTRFLEVFRVQNSGSVSASAYHGLYILEEKIKVSKHRVDIDRLGPTDVKAPEVTGGYLLKIDRTGPDEGGFSGAGAGMVYVEPKEQLMRLPQRAPQRHYLEKFFDDFDRALHGPNWKDPVEGYRAYIDVDAWIDFHVLELLSGNVDTLVLSTYFHKPRNGKLVFGPHWDFDRALGSTDGRDDDPRRWNTGRFFDAPWWDQLFSDPDFWQQWVDRWQELRQTHFSLANLNGLIDELTDEVWEAQPREVKRWGLQPRGGSYRSEINLMKSWLSNRVDYIDQQLVQPPRMSQDGGRVSPGFVLSLKASTNATIHYTLDGSDPRLPQGAVSPKSLVYTNPIALSSNVQVVARARNPNQRQTDGPRISTPWSAPAKAAFVAAQKR